MIGRNRCGTKILDFPIRRKTAGLFRRTNLVPLLGATFAAMLFLQALARTNCWLGRTKFSSLGELTLLDPGSAVALLGAFISLAFVRSQFVYSSTPIFDWRISREERSTSSDPSSEKKVSVVRVVSLHNVGPGVGIVTKARYWLEAKSPADSPSPDNYLDWFRVREQTYGNSERYKMDFNAVKKWLEARGFIEDIHWIAINFGTGSAIGPGANREIMVLNEELATSLAAFDLKLEYQSALRDRDALEIFMVPRRQFGTAPKKPSQKLLESELPRLEQDPVRGRETGQD